MNPKAVVDKSFYVVNRSLKSVWATDVFVGFGGNAVEADRDVTQLIAFQSVQIEEAEIKGIGG